LALVDLQSSVRTPPTYGVTNCFLTSDFSLALATTATKTVGSTTRNAILVPSECLTGNVFGSPRCDCGNQLQMALQQISDEGNGLVVESEVRVRMPASAPSKMPFYRGRIDQNPNFGRRESPRIRTHKNNVYLSTIPPSQSKIVGNSYNLIMDDTFPPIGIKILRYSC
jgi:hypothetical protein